MNHTEANHGRNIIDEIREGDPRRLAIIKVGSDISTIRSDYHLDRASVADELGVSEDELKKLELGQSVDDEELDSLLRKCRNWVLRFSTL